MATASRFKLSERASTNLRRFLLYPLYFLFCLVLFAYWTFPYERVRDFLVRQVEQQMPGAELEIVSLEPAWITGIEARGVQLRFPPEEGEERPQQLTIPSVYARAGILAYLGGTTEVTFAVETDGATPGTIEGVFSEEEAQTHVQAHLANVDLGRLGVIRQYAGLPIAGVVSGDVDVTLAEELEGTTGNIQLAIAGLAVGDGRAQVRIPGMSSGITVEQLNAGDLALTIAIERGVGRVQELHADGDDLELTGTGTIRLLRPVRMTSLDLTLRADIKPAYRERNDRTRGMFGFIGMAPQVREFTAPDGAYQFRLTGSVGSRISAQGAGSASFPAQ